MEIRLTGSHRYQCSCSLDLPLGDEEEKILVNLEYNMSWKGALVPINAWCPEKDWVPRILGVIQTTGACYKRDSLTNTVTEIKKIVIEAVPPRSGSTAS